jgi:hypothetical protein
VGYEEAVLPDTRLERLCATILKRAYAIRIVVYLAAFKRVLVAPGPAYISLICQSVRPQGYTIPIKITWLEKAYEICIDSLVDKRTRIWLVQIQPTRTTGDVFLCICLLVHC